MDISSFLIPAINEDPCADIEARIVSEIAKVDRNPYYLPIPKDKVRHFVLNLTSEYRYTDEESSEWIKGISSEFGGHPLRFFWSGYGTPSIEKFSQHIYEECRAAFLSFEYSEHRDHFFHDRDDIALSDVWRFIKNQHKDYSKTEDFIRDFDYWKDRLYQSQKWLHYMSGELEWYGGYVSIGDRIYDFLDLQDRVC